MFRILHISDLHRSPDDPIDNDALLAALDRDFERQRCENPEIGPIDAVIVSGDVIQGVPLGTDSPSQKISEQYEYAIQFLAEFTDRYLSGDRARVVLMPGNHDVDWNTAFSAMEEVPAEKQDTDLRKYLVPRSSHRYCLKNRKLYEIVDQAKYEERFQAFWSFMQSFYQKVDLAYELRESGYYNLFELDSGRIAVAAFNSCNQNDCFRHVGSIPDGTIGRAHLRLSDSQKNHAKDYALRIASWHHSIQGPPEKNDYMDIELVREMVNTGFRLGFHGHQHRTEVFPESIRLPDEETMVVISAGSLCVGAKELPPGEKRQYNIIEIGDNYRSARVHVREMAYQRAFGPRHILSFGGRSYFDIEWSPLLTPVGTELDTERSHILSAIIEAESLVADHPDDAGSILEPYLSKLPSHGRKVLLEARENAKQWLKIREEFDPPTSITEFMALLHSLEELGEHQEALDVISEYAAEVSLPESQKAELLKRFRSLMELER